ncbi:MAG: uracil-DNA glycosylase family protein [Pseudomonadota bacterium]
MGALQSLQSDIQKCRLCADRFLGTATAHVPRPVIWFEPGARLLIVGQAPGARVHASGRPFTDRSGDRLRAWLGLSDATFYDRRRVAIVPMAFCFPGYDAKGSDLPPPKLCAETWRAQVMAGLDGVRLTLVIGAYAQKWHLGQAAAKSVSATVAKWRDLPGDVLALPHPSWRNTAWLQRNPWFESDLLPVIRARVAEALA